MPRKHQPSDTEDNISAGFYVPGNVDAPAEIAVLIPCFNEEITISKVVTDFKRVLPSATIYVYDNNSTDNTADIARDAGAIVVGECRQGKGNVLRQMARDINADYYIIVDGDDTYPADAAVEMIRILERNEADTVVGDRISNGTYKRENTRVFHEFGNNLVRSLIHKIYNRELLDVMTGYRAFNKVFMKTLPITTSGFEVETELTIHAVDKRWRIAEIPVEYRDRPEGSESKLDTLRDGAKVLYTILSLFKDYRPLTLFTVLAVFLVCCGVAVAVPIIAEYFATGLVPRIPSLMLAIVITSGGAACLCYGLILDTVVKGTRKEYELQVIRAYEHYARELEQRQGNIQKICAKSKEQQIME